jgi:hypothetical protein
MSWASKNHIYHKQSLDIEGAESEFKSLKSRYAASEDVEASMYHTSSMQGAGRLIYIGANKPLPMGADWTRKDKPDQIA